MRGLLVTHELWNDDVALRGLILEWVADDCESIGCELDPRSPIVVVHDVAPAKEKPVAPTHADNEGRPFADIHVALVYRCVHGWKKPSADWPMEFHFDPLSDLT